MLEMSKFAILMFISLIFAIMYNILLYYIRKITGDYLFEVEKTLWVMGEMRIYKVI